MKASKLVAYLQELVVKYNDPEVDMLTETDTTGQVEQPVEDVAYSKRENRVKLLPKNF